MSNQSKKRDDQANELRKLLNEVQQSETTQEKKSSSYIADSVPTREVDILNLPTRKEVHNEKGKRTKIKVSRPYLRLYVVIILILSIVAIAYYLWEEEIVSLFSSF
ncbi:hypothetical protein ACFQ3N_14025 [Virgibacillus byunsanensis]|uniref:Uncharacterized protein n=1 Tax=Virgibacillus byunsanensis TaxID=570945 RepID=A0ABW3LM88_9BACI